MKRITFLITAAFAMLLFVVVSPGQATAQGGDDPAVAEAGKAVFEMNCAGCHAEDGTGVAGRGRPLTGIAGQGDRARHIASVTDGRGGMPAFGENLSADEIDQAVTYARLTFVEPEPAVISESDDDSADAGETTAETTELALTGVDSAELALIGGALVLGGAQLVHWSRRRQQ